MHVSDLIFSEMVRLAKEMQEENIDQSIDAIAMNSIQNVLKQENIELSSSQLGDVLFQVVYAMRD